MKITQTLTVWLDSEEEFPVAATAAYSGGAITLIAQKLEAHPNDLGKWEVRAQGRKARKDGTPGSYTGGAAVKFVDLPSSIRMALAERLS